MDFVAESLNKLQNLGLEGKINVFTLGRTAEVTLVPIKRVVYV
jgi:hypothetical protein